MKLYKYCSEIGGVKLLETARLRLSPPDRFNDPFEFAVNIDHSTINKEGLREYLRTSENMFEGWQEKVAGDQDPIAARKYYNEHLDEITENLYARRSENFLIQQENNCKLASQIWAVGCFSERPDSILMWSHYSNQHQGMLIEFDSDYLPFNGPDDLMKVRYLDEKPVYVYQFGMDGFDD